MAPWSWRGQWLEEGQSRTLWRVVLGLRAPESDAGGLGWHPKVSSSTELPHAVAAAGPGSTLEDPCPKAWGPGWGLLARVSEEQLVNMAVAGLGILCQDSPLCVSSNSISRTYLQGIDHIVFCFPGSLIFVTVIYGDFSRMLDTCFRVNHYYRFFFPYEFLA